MLHGKFNISGTTQIYNIASVLGFPVTNVYVVDYDTQILTSGSWSFSPITQELTFSTGVTDSIEINFFYTISASANRLLLSTFPISGGDSQGPYTLPSGAVIEAVGYDTAVLPYDGGANWTASGNELTFVIGVVTGIEVNVFYTLASSGSGLQSGKFNTSGTTQVYNLAAILGFPVASVGEVDYDTYILPSANWSFDTTTQNLTFVVDVSSGIQINFFYLKA